MTPQEWGPLAARIDAWWSRPEFTEERSAFYFELLSDYQLDDVEEAFRELLSESLQYLPSLSVVLGKLEENSDPSLRFETMWRAVKASLNDERPERFLETEHPLYLRFYIEQGGPQVLGRVDEGNSYAMHQLRMAWKELSGEHRSEVRKGSVRRALQARPLVPKGGGGFKKLPTAAALPAGSASSGVG